MQPIAFNIHQRDHPENRLWIDPEGNKWWATDAEIKQNVTPTTLLTWTRDLHAEDAAMHMTFDPHGVITRAIIEGPRLNRFDRMMNRCHAVLTDHASGPFLGGLFLTGLMMFDFISYNSWATGCWCFGFCFMGAAMLGQPKERRTNRGL